MAKKITDKMRLDWIQKNSANIWYDCGCCLISYAGQIRKSVDAKIRAELKRGGKQ